MSTLTVSNVSDGSLSIPTTYVTNGSAKAWVNFNGTGTIAARDSMNISSLTDNGTGDYTAAWANAMANINYSHVGMGGNNSTNLINVSQPVNAYAPTTGAARYVANFQNNSLVDAGYVAVAIHGDLA
jgi:hypothetical protein